MTTLDSRFRYLFGGQSSLSTKVARFVRSVLLRGKKVALTLGPSAQTECLYGSLASSETTLGHLQLLGTSRVGFMSLVKP